MHNCPICGGACDCDMEDMWNEPPGDCRCKRRCEKIEDAIEESDEYQELGDV